MSSFDKNKKKSSSSRKASLKPRKKILTPTSLTTFSELSAPVKSETKLTTTEQLDFKKLFEQALVRHKKDIFEDKKDKLQEISHLASMAEEYLSTFALIGYSLQNEKVVIFNVKNSKDEAALVDLLRATFIEIVNNRP